MRFQLDKQYMESKIETLFEMRKRYARRPIPAPRTAPLRGKKLRSFSSPLIENWAKKTLVSWTHLLPWLQKVERTFSKSCSVRTSCLTCCLVMSKTRVRSLEVHS